jgi:hypothetical protein
MILLKLQKTIMPESYFYYARLIDGLSEDVSYLGVLFRTSVPLVTGLVAALAALSFQHIENPELIGLAVGFFSAFCLVWPDFYNPELISPTYAHQKSKLYILYLIVIIIFSLAGWLGGILAPFAYSNIDPSTATSNLDFKSIFNGIVCAVIVAILSAVYKIIAQMFRSEDQQESD